MSSISDDLKAIHQQMEQTEILSNSLAQTDKTSGKKRSKQIPQSTSAKQLSEQVAKLQQGAEEIVSFSDKVSEDALKGSLSPTKNPSRRISSSRGFGGFANTPQSPPPFTGSSSKDVGFVADLGEGLLAECRRLQAALMMREEKLKERDEDLDNLRARMASQEAQLASLRASEESAREVNWNLEVQIQDLKSDLDKKSELASKVRSESTKLKSDRSDQFDLIEDLKLRESSLKREISTLKSRFEQESMHYIKERENLQAESETLHKKVSDLESQLTTERKVSGSQMAASRRKSTIIDDAQDDDSDLYDTPTNSPPMSPVKAIPADSHALDTESLRANLTHASRTIASLRVTIKKERDEKSALKRLLSSAQDEVERFTSGAPPSLRAQHSAASFKKRAVMAKGKAKERVIASSPGQAPNSWEDVSVSEQQQTLDNAIAAGAAVPVPILARERNPILASSESDNFHSAYETAPSETESEFYSVDSTFHSGEDVDTETEENAASADADRTFGPELNSSSSDDDSEQNSSLRRSFRYRRSQPVLRDITLQHPAGVESEAAALKHSGTDNSLANEFMSIDDLQEHAERHGMVLRPINEQPSKDSILAGAAALGFAIAPSNFDTPEFARELAEKHDFVAIPSDEYSSLKSPPQEILDLHAASKGLVLAPSNYQSVEALKENLQKHGLITVAESDLKNLQSPDRDALSAHAATLGLVLAPSNYASREYIIQQAADAHNLVTLPAEEHAELTRPFTADDLHEKANSLNMSLVTPEQLTKLQNPSVSEMKAHATSLNHVIIPQSEYSSLTKDKTIDDAKEIAKQHDQILVPNAEYTELTRPLTAADIQAKAATLDMVALPLAEYTEKTREPTEEELKQKATNRGFVAIPSKEYFDLVRLTNSPSPEEIKIKAKKLGFEMITKDKLQTLENPTADTLAVKASSLGLSLVPEEELSELQRASSDPTNEEIEKHAKSRGLVVVPDVKYKEVSQLAEEPTREHLDLKAHALGFSLLPVEDYRKFQNPTHEHLSHQAKDLGLTVVQKDEYDNLHRLANTPDHTHISEKASAMGLVVLDEAAHNDNIRKSTKPTRRELEEHAYAQDLVLINKRAHEELTRPLTAEELNQRASPFNKILVDETEFENLKKTVNEPSIDYLSEKASQHKLAAIPVEKLNALENPPIDILKQHADSHGMSLIETEQLRALQEPSLESAKETAIKYHQVIISEDDLNSLKNPTQEQVIKLLSGFSMIPLKEEEYESLKTPSKENVESMARGYGLVAIPASEYQDVSAKANKPIDKSFVESAAAGLGLSVLSSSALASLKSPSVDALHDHAKRHDMSVVSNTEIEKSRGTIEQLQQRNLSLEQKVEAADKALSAVKAQQESPSVEFVTSMATLAGLKALQESEYEALKEPSVEVLIEKLKNHGQAAIREKELAELQRRALKPSRDELGAVAKSEGLELLDADDVKEMKRRINDPTYDELKQVAKQLHLSILTAHELDDLRREPELNEFVKSKGAVALPVADYNELQRKATAPSESELSSYAAGAGMAVVGTAVLAALKKKADTPSLEAVKQQASNHGLVTITSKELSAYQKPSAKTLQKLCADAGLLAVSEKELNDLKRRSAAPSREELDAICAQQGLAVVTIDNLQTLTRRAEEPTKEDLARNANKQGLEVLPRGELEELKRDLTAEELKLKASSLGFESIPSTDYIELKRRAYEPSMEEIIKVASAHAMVAVPKDEYDTVERDATEPSQELILRHARRHGMSLLQAAELEELNKKAFQPSKSDVELAAKKHSLVTLSKEQYQALLDAKRSSPVKDLSSVAAKREHFEDIIKQSQISKGSREGEKVVESIRSLGYVPVLSEEYKKLLENQAAAQPTKREVVRAAKSFGLMTMPVEDYNKIMNRGDHSRGETGSVSSAADFNDFSFSQDSPTPKSTSSPAKEINSFIPDPKLAELGLTTVPEVYLASLRKIVESPSERDIEMLAKKAGVDLNVKSSAKIGEEGDVKDTVRNDANHVDHKADELTPEELELAAGKVGYAVVPESELTVLKEAQKNAANRSNLESFAKTNGLVLVANDEYEKLNNAKDISHDDVLAYAKAHNYKVVDVNEKAFVGRDEVNAFAKAAGLTLVAEDTLMMLKNKAEKPVITKAQVEDYASKHGLVLTEPHSEQAETRSVSPEKAPLTASSVSQYARDNNLFLLSRDEFQKLQKPTIAPPTDELLQKHAADHHLRLVSEDEYLKLREMAPQDAVKRCKDLGFKVMPVSEYDKIVKPSASVLTTQAKGLGLMVLSTNEYNNLKNAQTQSRDAYFSGTDLDIKDTTRHANYVPGRSALGSGFVATGSGHGGQAGGDSEASSVASFSTPRKDNASINIPHQRTESITSNILNSAATIGTNVSFTNQSIIPLVTQTVIGEYLFKYVRTFGVTGISENRHERYFWIHPYSLTLYWSPENPALESKRGKQTKSAPITGIRWVEDRNPLPPGLYHKTIIVSTGSREVRITCPTRHQHNVWYNSLLYLIKRSSDDVTFDVEDDPNLENHREDSKLARERARSVSQLSSRSNRVVSMRRGLAPELNKRSSTRSSSIRLPSPGHTRGDVHSVMSLRSSQHQTPDGLRQINEQ